jgi:hypothetical protein
MGLGDIKPAPKFMIFSLSELLGKSLNGDMQTLQLFQPEIKLISGASGKLNRRRVASEPEVGL